MKTMENEQGLLTVLNDSSVSKPCKDSVRKGLSARMMSVNDALNDHLFRERAWQVLGISNKTTIPPLRTSGALLYGDVSAAIHFPMLNFVYLSDSLSEEWAQFFSEVTRVLSIDSSLVIYSENDAAYGKQQDPS